MQECFDFTSHEAESGNSCQIMPQIATACSLPEGADGGQESGKLIARAKVHQSRKSSNYYWSRAENGRYLTAVVRYQKLLEESTQMRRLNRVNVKISRIVRTRSALQCHSHHQKMVGRFGSIQAIVDGLALELSNGSPDGSMKPASGKRGRKPRAAVEAKHEQAMEEAAVVPMIAEEVIMGSPAEDHVYLEAMEINQRYENRPREYDEIEIGNTWELWLDLEYQVDREPFV